MVETPRAPTVDDFVAALDAHGSRLPFEIGAFVALEVCERLIEQPATVDTNRVCIGPQGEVLVQPGVGGGDEEQAARSVGRLLGTLLSACGAGVPPLLKELAELGPASGQWRLGPMRDELEAALIPLNRAAARRVLGRLVREVQRKGSRPARGRMLDPGRSPDPARRPGPTNGGAAPAPTRTSKASGTASRPLATNQAPAADEDPFAELDDLLDSVAPPPATSPTPHDASLASVTSASAPLASPAAPVEAPSGTAAPPSAPPQAHERITPVGDLTPATLDVELDDLLGGDSVEATPGPSASAPTPGVQEAPAPAPSQGTPREPSEAMWVHSGEVSLASDSTELPTEEPVDPGPAALPRAEDERAPAPSPQGGRGQAVPKGVFATWKLDAPPEPVAVPTDVSPATAAASVPVTASPSKPAASIGESATAPTGQPPAATSPRTDDESPAPAGTPAFDPEEAFDDAAAVAAMRGGRGRWIALLALAAMGGLLGYVALKRPDVLQRMLGRGDPEAERRAAERAEAQEKAEQQALEAHRRRFGTLVVETEPKDAQVFLKVGEGPATARDLPSGMAYEVLAVAGGHRPARAVVPAGARWAPDERARPRYELAIQLQKLPEDEAGPVDFGATLLKPPMGEPGPLGDLRVVTNPPGAEVFLLVGFGPEVRVEDFRTDEPFELLVHAPEHDPQRLRLKPSDWAEEAGTMVLRRKVALTPRPAAD